MADDTETEGEYVDFVEAPVDVEETDDGGALVLLEGATGTPEDSEFYHTLAETLDPVELASTATNLLDLIAIDRESRKKRDEQYAEGLRRTGLGDDAPGGAQFQGASRVVHPMLTEGCIDFSSRAMKELFPSSGPVKESIPGKLTAAKLAKARRKVNFLNWQLTIKCKEFRAELEQLMTQVPMGGDQYLKIAWDTRRNRPQFLFVGIDEMYLPYAATNFYTAQRRTHVQYITQLEYQQKVDSGEWRDADLVTAGMDLVGELSDSAKANEKIEGRQETGFNKDGQRVVYSVYAILNIDDPENGGESAPYIITIDETTREVLALYRNWNDDDEAREELQWFVQWPFVPWRGAYSIGLPHMIGGLSAAATGALRALLDSAHINNTPSLLKLKGAKVGGQNTSPQPGEALEIEGGLQVDDIRKVAMALPFNPPSTVLFELLGFLVQAGKGVVRTALDDMPDMSADVPVGTTLARLEQGLTVYSAIHGRLHDAMARTISIVDRLNGQNLDVEAVRKEVGEDLIDEGDFDGPLDVIPVSDPAIFSETQRIARTQLIAQRADVRPELYDQRKVEEYILTQFKLPEGVDLLAPAATPKEQNAVNENVAASLGRPVTAFPEQDHVAHLQTHIAYMQSPLFGGLPLIAPSFLPLMLGHIREHIALWYASKVFEFASAAMGKDIGDFLRDMDGEPMTESRKALDAMLAEAANKVVTGAGQELAAIPQIVQQAQQMLQQMQPQPPVDPIIALEQQRVQQEAQIDQAKLQQDAQEHTDDIAFKQQKLQTDAQIKAGDTQARVGMNTEDNQTAMLLAAQGARRGQNANPNPRP